MTERKPFIAVNLTPAMSGYFATLYCWSQGEGGVDIHGNAFDPYWFPEPYTTGIGRYPTWQEANVEAAAWAEAEGLECHLATPERIAKAEASAARSQARMARFRELVAEGIEPKAALAQAKEEMPDA